MKDMETISRERDPRARAIGLAGLIRHYQAQMAQYVADRDRCMWRAAHLLRVLNPGRFTPGSEHIPPRRLVDGTLQPAYTRVWFYGLSKAIREVVPVSATTYSKIMAKEPASAEVSGDPDLPPLPTVPDVDWDNPTQLLAHARMLTIHAAHVRTLIDDAGQAKKDALRAMAAAGMAGPVIARETGQSRVTVNHAVSTTLTARPAAAPGR